MKSGRSIAILAVVGFCILALLAGDARAEVNLEWRSESAHVMIGNTVSVGLYAVSNNATDQSISALDTNISWDPGALELLGKVDNGPYSWLGSWFPDDRGLDGLNADCSPELFCVPYSFIPFNDGDAKYGTFAFSTPAYATPEGLLVTTVEFLAIGATDSTELRILAQMGDWSYSRVLSASPLGANVTGTLGSLTLAVFPCGSHGDFDGDCELTLTDFRHFSSCLTGPQSGLVGLECDWADSTQDGYVDLRDVAEFQVDFLGMANVE